MNNVTVSDFNDLFSSWPAGNEVVVHRDIPEYFGCGLERLSLKFKFKCSKRPCSYYSNSLATFLCLLVGDLVCKLNLGPLHKHGNSILSYCSRTHCASLPTRPRNLSNLVTVDRVSFNGICDT